LLQVRPRCEVQTDDEGSDVGRRVEPRLRDLRDAPLLAEGLFGLQVPRESNFRVGNFQAPPKVQVRIGAIATEFLNDCDAKVLAAFASCKQSLAASGAELLGVDRSPEMIAEACKKFPHLRFEVCDARTLQFSNEFDAVFSNAALHWLPDHARVFPALLAGLAPGGVLAVQIPRNFSAPSHTSISEAARRGPWRAKLEPLLRPAPVAEPDFYYGLLAPKAASLDMWETEYVHALEGKDPVKEWVKGTWLRPLLDALAGQERADFESAYAALVARAYPPRADGRTLFPFRRLFIVATA